MKHILSILFCLLFFQTLSWSDVNSGKLDPYLGLLTVYPERIHIVKEQTEILEKQKSASLDVIVTFRNQLKGISKIGGQIVCSYKDMAVCTIPYYKLDELASLKNVVYIEHSYKSIATLDKSAPAISVSRAKQDFNLYGENVIVGIIDSGIDWQHESFRDRDGKTRIKYILDLSQAGSVYGGKVFTAEDINAVLRTWHSYSRYSRW
jgi:subtilisin family serine protease